MLILKRKRYKFQQGCKLNRGIFVIVNLHCYLKRNLQIRHAVEAIFYDYTIEEKMSTHWEMTTEKLKLFDLV